MVLVFRLRNQKFHRNSLAAQPTASNQCSAVCSCRCFAGTGSADRKNRCGWLLTCLSADIQSLYLCAAFVAVGFFIVYAICSFDLLSALCAVCVVIVVSELNEWSSLEVGIYLYTRHARFVVRRVFLCVCVYVRVYTTCIDK